MATNPSPQKLIIPQTNLTQAMQSSVKNFLIIIGVGTALIVCIGGYFIWNLANKNVQAANKIKAQDIYMKLATEKSKSLSDSESIVTELKKPQSNGVSDYELVTERTLPNTDDLGILLTMFQKLEADTLVKIDTITKQADGSTSTASVATATPAVSDSLVAQAFPLTFKATGSYEQIQKFLKKLEIANRVFDFSNLKISGADGQTSIDLSYRLYYLPAQSLDDKEVPINEYKEGATQ